MGIRLERLDATRTAEHIELIVTALGNVPTEEGARRWALFPEARLRLAAFDERQLVGTLGGFHFEMTAPGGAFVPTLGLTVVAVRPTHRRQGVLRAMVGEALLEARREGQPLSALFASEASIYGRFGYGLASLVASVSVDPRRSAFRRGLDLGAARPRQLAKEEALATFPRIWDAVRPTRPGMLGRSALWWALRRVDEPEWRRGGRGLLQHVVFEEGGAPVAYAIYRHGRGFEHGASTAAHEAYELLGVRPSAVLAAWRFVLDLDLGERVTASLLPHDHPLVFALQDPGALRLRSEPGLFVRVVDVEAAFARRRLPGSGAVVVEVQDPLCPWNEGRFRLSRAGAERTDAAAELSLDAETLGALYLGGSSAAALAQAGRLRCTDVEAPARLDEVLGRFPAPWCPEMF